MSVISALISKKGVAVASDSFLTTFSKGEYKIIESKQSKIIRLEKFRGSISYWGFAGNLKHHDEKAKKSSWHWETFSWLTKQCQNPTENNIEEFVFNLQRKLADEIKKFPSNNKKAYGIGLHITAFEYIDGYWIPELFLISNYKDPSYQNIGTLSYSRNTYHTIAEVPPNPEHKNKESRLRVRKYLSDGGLIWYNNGDPILYNTVAQSIFDSVKIAKQREILKEFKTVKDMLPLVKIPIKTISEIQKGFYKSGKKIVGGRTYGLAVSPNGEYFRDDN